VYVIRIEAFDWNCQQHIVPRYTEEEIREAVAPAEHRMRELENENQKLREEISRLSKTNGNSLNQVSRKEKADANNHD